MGDLGTTHGASRHVGWHVEALRSHAHAALPLTQMITEHLPLTLRKHLSVYGPLGKKGRKLLLLCLFSYVSGFVRFPISELSW